MWKNHRTTLSQRCQTYVEYVGDGRDRMSGEVVKLFHAREELQEDYQRYAGHRRKQKRHINRDRCGLEVKI